MIDNIVHGSDGITLLGGGKARPGELEEALSLAPCLVAVDGGAAFAVEQDKRPVAVLGDMDSISETVRGALPPDILHPFADQDSTDFDKALRSVRAPLVLGVGFLGRRVDHQLANFNVLVRYRNRPCILIGKHDIVLAAPPQMSIRLAPGSRVSLFPMASVQGHSRGLHWPIDGLDLAPDGRIGTSNRVKSGWTQPVDLEFDRAGMLIILPRAALRAAIAALTTGAQPARAR